MMWHFTALAAASHNEFFEILLNSLAGALIQVRRVALNVPGTPRRALVHHRGILNAVTRGQVEAARKAMEKHLIEAEATARPCGRSAKRVKF